MKQCNYSTKIKLISLYLNKLKGFSNKTSVLNEKIGSIPRFTILYAGTFGRVNGIDYVITFAEKLLILDSSICFVLTIEWQIVALGERCKSLA